MWGGKGERIVGGDVSVERGEGESVRRWMVMRGGEFGVSMNSAVGWIY
jgi:hypothetical protein